MADKVWQLVEWKATFSRHLEKSKQQQSKILRTEISGNNIILEI